MELGALGLDRGAVGVDVVLVLGPLLEGRVDHHLALTSLTLIRNGQRGLLNSRSRLRNL